MQSAAEARGAAIERAPGLLETKFQIKRKVLKGTCISLVQFLLPFPVSVPFIYATCERREREQSSWPALSSSITCKARASTYS